MATLGRIGLVRRAAILLSTEPGDVPNLVRKVWSPPLSLLLLL